MPRKHFMLKQQTPLCRIGGRRNRILGRICRLSKQTDIVQMAEPAQSAVKLQLDRVPGSANTAFNPGAEGNSEVSR